MNGPLCLWACDCPERSRAPMSATQCDPVCKREQASRRSNKTKSGGIPSRLVLIGTRRTLRRGTTATAPLRPIASQPGLASLRLNVLGQHGRISFFVPPALAYPLSSYTVDTPLLEGLIEIRSCCAHSTSACPSPPLPWTCRSVPLPPLLWPTARADAGLCERGVAWS